MATKKIVVANWKMNPLTSGEANLLFKSLSNYLKDTYGAEVVICPPTIYLPLIKYFDIEAKIGAQDMFWETKGAFTGETSPLMLKDYDCRYAILGHSERRKYKCETDEMVNLKLMAAIQNRINPIVCVGESSKGEDIGDSYKIIEEQLKKAFAGVENFAPLPVSVIIAYEPVWAIGSGETPSANKILSMSLFIKKIISGLYNEKAADKITILYGGSVNAKNAEVFVKEGGVDGFLVGSASLNVVEFIKIIQATGM